MKEAKEMAMRDVAGCFFGGALCAVVLASLVGAAVLLWSGGTAADLAMWAFMLTVYLFSAVVTGGMCGLSLFLSPPRGRPYLKSLVYAAVASLVAVAIGLYAAKGMSLQTRALLGGTLFIGFTTWAWLTVLVARRLFKVSI